jgi:hypothetical protein
MEATASLPSGMMEESPRIGTRTFEHNGQTWVYDPNLITMQQAVIADEALQFKLELMQREPESFTVVVESGGVEWFSKCAGALLVQVRDGVVVPHSPLQWSAATRFLSELPYGHMSVLKECVEDFFGSIGRQRAVSFAFKGKSQMISNPIVSELFRKSMKSMLPQGQS